MSQRETWKKRPAELAEKIKDRHRNWLGTGENARRADSSGDRQPAGVKRRKY